MNPIIAGLEPASPEAAVVTLLRYMGEDVSRDGLRDTPARVVRAWREMTAGYSLDPAEILSRTFPLDDDDSGIRYGGMVVLRDIEIHSMCEHHMLPFVGQAHIVYIPGEDGRVVGVSKLARLVDLYARRLQVQERLTAQIADAIAQHLRAKGVLVVIEASHFCMRMRGVGKQRSEMVTSEVRGVLHDEHSARDEALRLIGR